MTPLELPLSLVEVDGVPRSACAFRVGAPLPRGLCADADDLAVTMSAGRLLPTQCRALARWPDRSIKWLLVDAIAPLEAGQHLDLVLRRALTGEAARAGFPRVVVTERGAEIEVDTGRARFHLSGATIGPVSSVALAGANLLSGTGSDLALTSRSGERLAGCIERRFVEECGPVRASIVTEGSFAAGARQLRFLTRTIFHAGSCAIRFEVTLHNPHAADHRGGRWDLGDPGSLHLDDVTLRITPAGATGLEWYAAPGEPISTAAATEWLLYQDSSGGENWRSDNHLDGASQPTVSFRGFEVRADGVEPRRGERATPCLSVDTNAGWVAASVEDFWQNFPKALRFRAGALEVGLFPRESRGRLELQGGERKRHAVLLDFGLPDAGSELPQLQSPPLVHVDAKWLEASGALSHFASSLDASSAPYAEYVDRIVSGPGSFFAKREIIDEYGWRNFGDLYADHEAVRHPGPGAFISHYNNQYDFVYGAFQHFERTGDQRWFRLMQDAARHVMDIDIYHTMEDKAAFSGGLFWHTDHYMPARTSSHRTYSSLNSAGADYGGGPSCEHNYTSGLLHYYYLTGDEAARAAVIGLADWVLRMDEGSGTLLSIVDDSPTGLASCTVSPDYHKVGRGAGNSINALLDAHALSRDRRYLRKAEQLVERCIHPGDDIAALGLLEPEYRWSYLVFLQVLGKYLDQKREWGELDYSFYYARDSLLHYARWMAEHEVPYKDVLHKVEIPTETWPAHDVRKSHVLYIAAKYGPEEQRDSLRSRAAFFFQRCVTDVTSFATSGLTRPLVILCVYGGVQAYYGNPHASSGASYQVHHYEFGAPQVFVPQRKNLKAALGRKRAVITAELRRIVRDKLNGLSRRWRRAS